MSEIGTLDPSQLYRRQARRIRGRCMGHPEQLYRSLRQLSDRHDAIAAELPLRDAIRPPSQQPADVFARFVANRLEGKILRYSTRLELLQVASGLGISRFYANLMIAAMQHQLGDETAHLPAERSPTRWPLIAAAVLMLQSGILFAAWELFAR